MDDSHAQPTSSFRHGTADGALWPAQPVQLARGRQPRDALAKIVSFDVSSLDDFETSLRQYLDDPPEQPEHTEAQLSFWIGTTFLVSTVPPAPNTRQPPPQPPSQQQQQQQQPQQPQQPQQQQQQQQPHLAQHQRHAHPHAPPGYQPANGLPQQYGRPSHAYQGLSDPAVALGLPNLPQAADTNNGEGSNGTNKVEYKTNLSILDALRPTPDPKDKMRKQRAIAKCCVDTIQRIDGYRYSFHNCWNSREDDSFRFSYYCNDSLLNKDRAANGKGAKLGKRATKPVYDCKGVLSIKFSATKQTLDVFYKHVPIHKTYEERAPPPRKDSKRRKFLQVNDPEALARIVTRPKSKEDSEDPEAQSKPKRKKSVQNPEPPRPSNTSLESDLRAQSLRSLLELIQTDPSPQEPMPPEPPRPPPPPPPPPPHPRQPIVAPSLPMQQPPVQARRRPRNSCDICKAKKTKCDGARPVCQTCADKNRQCFYSEPASGDDARIESNGVQQQPQPTKELSEYEKMKKELEEARQRIQELESEKRASTTPIQTPQMAQRPPSQPQPPPPTQPQVRHQRSHSQAQPHTQQQLPRQAAPQQHRQQLQQVNRSMSLHSPQQVPYKIDTSPQQPRILNAQPSLQTPSSQNMQSATQQLQVAAQQLQTGQHPQQLQSSQTYYTSAHPNHSSYTNLNRSMSGPQQPPSQSPQQTLPQPVVTGSLPDTAVYGRSDFAWPPAAYYGYQNPQQPQQQQQQQHAHPQQQQQQDQWGGGRGAGVFR